MRRAVRATCTRSGTRALAPVRGAPAPPLAQRAEHADAPRQRLVRAARAARRERSSCACASRPTGRSRAGRGCVRRGAGRLDAACRRAAPGDAARRRRLLARARVRSTAPRCAADARRAARSSRLHDDASLAPASLQARVLPHGWLDALRQVSLFAAAYYAYRLVRGLVEGDAQRGRSRTRAT